VRRLVGDFRLAVLSCSFLLAALVVGVQYSPPAAAAGRQHLTIYAVADKAQYVNIADGITRAQGHNPFNVDSKLPPPAKGKGELPGNSVFFSFKLYADSGLKQSIGTATYTCSFNFKQQATCDAYYDLDGNTLFASGPVDFTSTQSTLAVTGGTSKYLGVSGQVATLGPGAKPKAKNESRLDFVLLGG
jgi:hypothetical protein